MFRENNETLKEETKTMIVEPYAYDKNDGTTDYTQMILSIIENIGTEKSDMYFNMGNYVFKGNVTFPENITLYFESGVIFKPDTGITIVIKGKLDASLNTIFAGLGNIVFQGKTKEVYPQWWGAVSDGVTKCKDSLVAAIQCSASSNVALYFYDGIYDADDLTVTVEENLTILGQSKENTIIKNIGRIFFNKDLRIEDVTIFDSTQEYIFAPSPATGYYCNIKVNNIFADNTPSDTLKTGARRLFYYSNATDDKGVGILTVTNSEFSHYSKYIFCLLCHISSAYISNNRFTEIGANDVKSVIVIFLGYQGEGNIITAPAKNVHIMDNYFYNIYSLSGSDVTTGYNTTEGHAILIYGQTAVIKNNKVINLWGYNTTTGQRTLDSGYDHEAIYVKAFSTIIEGNYIENGAGNDADGAIACKGNSTDNKVINNEIIGSFGIAIHADSNNMQICGNIVNMDGAKIGIRVGGDFNIINNNVVTIKGTNATHGILVVSEDLVSGWKSVNNNTVNMQAGKAIYFSGSGIVEGNSIYTTGHQGIYLISSGTKGVTKASVIGNHVEISGNVALTPYNDCIMTAGGEPGKVTNYTIKNNILINNKVKDATYKSHCVGLYAATTYDVSGNYIYSSGDYCVFLASAVENGDVVIKDNHIIALNACVFDGNSASAFDIVIQNNKIEYSTDGTSTAVPSRMIELSTETASTCKIIGNVIKLNGSLEGVIRVASVQYVISDNIIEMASGITGYHARVIYIDNNTESSALNIVTDNKIIGTATYPVFLMYKNGAINIGTVRVKGNAVLLTSGSLIGVYGGGVLLTNDLLVENNYVKTSAAPSVKLISTAALPVANYTAAGNIER